MRKNYLRAIKVKEQYLCDALVLLDISDTDWYSTPKQVFKEKNGDYMIVVKVSGYSPYCEKVLSEQVAYIKENYQ